MLLVVTIMNIICAIMNFAERKYKLATLFCIFAIALILKMIVVKSIF